MQAYYIKLMLFVILLENKYFCNLIGCSTIIFSHLMGHCPVSTPCFFSEDKKSNCFDSKIGLTDRETFSYLKGKESQEQNIMKPLLM